MDSLEVCTRETVTLPLFFFFLSFVSVSLSGLKQATLNCPPTPPTTPQWRLHSSPPPLRPQVWPLHPRAAWQDVAVAGLVCVLPLGWAHVLFLEDLGRESPPSTWGRGHSGRSALRAVANDALACTDSARRLGPTGTEQPWPLLCVCDCIGWDGVGWGLCVWVCVIAWDGVGCGLCVCVCG